MAVKRPPVEYYMNKQGQWVPKPAPTPTPGPVTTPPPALDPNTGLGPPAPPGWIQKPDGTWAPPGTYTPPPDGYVPPPATSSPPSWWSSGAVNRPQAIGLADYMQQYLTNRLIPFLDPRTQWETGGWLARDAPDIYGQYGSQLTGSPPPLGYMPHREDQYFDPSRIGDILRTLNWNEVKKNLPASVQGDIAGGTSTAPAGASEAEIKAMAEANRQSGLDVRSGLHWLTEALRTAQQGMGKGATRAQQLWAAKHLNTMMTEAQTEPQITGRYTTLFENIVNPIVQRAPLSGIFGQSRALVTPSTFTRKGLVRRNPALT